VTEPVRGPLLVVAGPTASGKTALVELVAARGVALDAVAADAMQVYRGMDIGTAKPPREGPVKYHCIDLVEPTERFSAGRYALAATEAIAEIGRRERLPVMVGGTGLYIKAVVDGLRPLSRASGGNHVRERLEARAEREGPAALYAELVAADPLAAKKIPATNARRVIRALEWLAEGARPSELHEAFGSRPDRPDVWMVALSVDRERLRDRAQARVREMLDAGLLEEVRGLHDCARLGPTAGQAIGYKELVEHLEGALSWEDAVSKVVARTRQYAKRQITWFGRDPRVEWLDGGDLAACADRVVEGLRARGWIGR
jgi:tRNA dimethylallyltransferase